MTHLIKVEEIIYLIITILSYFDQVVSYFIRDKEFHFSGRGEFRDLVTSFALFRFGPMEEEEFGPGPTLALQNQKSSQQQHYNPPSKIYTPPSHDPA